MERFPLAGGCYVVPARAFEFTSRGVWHEAWAVNRELGGDALSMLRFEPARNAKDEPVDSWVTVSVGFAIR